MSLSLAGGWYGVSSSSRFPPASTKAALALTRISASSSSFARWFLGSLCFSGRRCRCFCFCVRPTAGGGFSLTHVRYPALAGRCCCMVQEASTELKLDPLQAGTAVKGSLMLLLVLLLVLLLLVLLLLLLPLLL